MKTNNWKLSSIRLRFISYGKDAGKYDGCIEFENGENESFKFNIYPEMANKYISLIADEIVIGADNLSKRVKTSLEKQGLLT